MRSLYLGVIVTILATITLQTASAQSNRNPDLSFIGDFRAWVQDTETAAGTEANKLQLEFTELEIAAGGYLNPYARADVALGLHGAEGGIDIEEAYLTLLRGLPLNLQLKAGQYLVDFGKINQQHPHQWVWITRPLMHQEFFGEEGFKDVGIQLSTLVPLGETALTLSGNILKTGGLGAQHHHDEATIEEETEMEPPPDLGFSGRAGVFVPLTPILGLELGGSFLNAEFDPDENRRANLIGADLTLKWKPSEYTSIKAQIEGIVQYRTVQEEDTLTGDSSEREVRSTGLLGAIDWRFHKRYNLGAFLDYTQGAQDSEENRTGYGITAGFSLMEESTRFGFLLRRDEGSDIETAYTTVLLQILWSLGPHKPHVF